MTYKVEYRELKDGPLRLVDAATFDVAQNLFERFLSKGFHDVVIRTAEYYRGTMPRQNRKMK